jgi:hypothetical protein
MSGWQGNRRHSLAEPCRRVRIRAALVCSTRRHRPCPLSLPVKLQTFCFYKGLCSYYAIGEAHLAAWSYPDAYAGVGCISNLVSFDIVAVHLRGAQLYLEPGQTVVPHGPDRNLDVAEVIPANNRSEDPGIDPADGAAGTSSANAHALAETISGGALAWSELANDSLDDPGFANLRHREASCRNIPHRGLLQLRGTVHNS